MSLPLIIVNPASRGGTGARDWNRAASTLARHFGPFERRFTSSPGDACRIARDEAASGRGLILTFGGDGTVSETARGILASGADCELGVLPHGTGADFIRTLKTPKRFGDAAQRLRDGRTVAIDVGRVVFGDGRELSFVNSASFGLSGEVAQGVNRVKKSGASYARKTLAAALSYPFPEVELTVNDETTARARITTVSLHNGRFFGGGMHMAPEADLTDGELQCIVVKKMSPGKILRCAPLMYWGAHLGVAELEHRSVRCLAAKPVRADEAVRVEVDGESPGCLPARFDVLPKALRLRLPAR